MTSPHPQHLSLNHTFLLDCLVHHDNLLVIQDLDGVCMQLVKDPRTRTLDPDYVAAVKAFDGHFFVLTNGEHIGRRGVNGIVDRALGTGSGWYLPGLAAGGVQWQTALGEVSHPGVSAEVLAFLDQIPTKMEACIDSFFSDHPVILDSETLKHCIQAAILDNKVSPTVNLNVFHEKLSHCPGVYQALQQAIAQLTTDLLGEAEKQGLKNDFFIHFAPNLGQDAQGNEIIQLAQDHDSGTTDFQFMLKGARKEVGILFLLNQYYGHHRGHFPLGKEFHVLNAPQSHRELLAVIQENFEPESMPLMVGVGDTVTSRGEPVNGELRFFRGGSDRGFLQLIQRIGEAFNRPNLTVYVDSSAGEVKNRKPIKVESRNGQDVVTEGPTDDRDRHDPLRLNVVLPGGHGQYIEIFKHAAAQRQQIA